MDGRGGLRTAPIHFTGPLSFRYPIGGTRCALWITAVSAAGAAKELHVRPPRCFVGVLDGEKRPLDRWVEPLFLSSASAADLRRCRLASICGLAFSSCRRSAMSYVIASSQSFS
jgi:hypothetical protein